VSARQPGYALTRRLAALFALLVLRFAGQAPLIEVNPGAMAIPELAPLPPQAPLTLAAVRHTLDRHGVPFIALALVRRGLRPLRELARQTGHIGMSNLAARLDGAGAPRELALLVDAFNAMLERLSNGFTRLSQVSADMAHDLRTPIANLLGQTEVALGQQRGTDYYEALLASNHEELQRLARMTDNMLFLARAA
jgi:two-component system heavy metal sensor histidine kinase CusS